MSGHFVATDASATTNYGVWASGSGASGTNYAAYFSGDGHVTGNWTSGSDRKLKRDIKELDGLEVLLKLSPRSYQFRTDKYPSMNLPGRPVIAQKVQKNHSYYSGNIQRFPMNYIGLIPFTISAIQQQQETVFQTTELEAKNLVFQSWKKKLPYYNGGSCSERGDGRIGGHAK